MADPVASVVDSEQGPRAGVSYWDQSMGRLNELGNHRIEFANRHAEDVAELRKQALGNQIVAADFVAKRIGLSYSEPNANEAGAIETMKSAGLPELTSANASAGMSSALTTGLATIQSAQASIAASIAALPNLIGAAVTNALLNAANQVPTRPSNQAVETGKP